MKRLITLAVAMAVVCVSVACARGGPASLEETPLPQSGEPATPPEVTAEPTATLAPEVTAEPTATLTVEAEPTPEPGEPPYEAGFAGSWDTDWGTLVFTVTGTIVVGTYADGEGRVDAVLAADGRSIEGTWGEAPDYAAPEHGGRVIFDLSEDGNSLSGHWWYGEDEEGGEWPGTRAEMAGPVSPPDEDATEGPVEGPGITLSSDPANDLLFYVTEEDGSRVYYYGLEEDGVLRLSHIVVEDGAGSQDVVIYDSRLLPAQWILPEMTVAVYPDPEGEEPAPEDESWFDPRQALHVVLRGEEEQTVTADIYPGDLGAVLDELEAATGQRFDGARAFLAAHDVSFEELAALANEGGPEQPLYIVAAAGFSAAAASLSLQEAGGEVAVAPRMRGPAAPMAVVFGQVIKVGASAAGGILADWLGEGLDPGDGPAVAVLLCRGAAKYGVCHYMFFRADRLGDCITLCQTSLGCFTDICMPMDISVEMAMSIRDRFR